MHFPSSAAALQEAKKRLAFEEVFELTLAALLNKYELYKDTAIAIQFKEALAKDFVAKLPFKLTDAQRKAVWQIYQDMSRTQPMNGSASAGFAFSSVSTSPRCAKSGSMELGGTR